MTSDPVTLPESDAPREAVADGARAAAEAVAAVRPVPAGVELPPSGTVTMFTTTWCGYCRRLKTQLDASGIGYTEVDVEEQPDAAALVEQLNDGNRTVPTVLFPDGSAATNPSVAQVRARLAG